MKKLLAILLSVLMLCAMIPFAAVVTAEEEPTVQIYLEETELNAGDEFQVTVNLLNIPDPGLIGAQVEVVFDHDIFELVTYFDEDEEVWLPQIEVGSKYNASGNKYILFGPIDAETGVSQNCLVQYLRSTASASQVRKEEHYFTATFRVKDDAVSGTYDLIADKYRGGNTVGYGPVSLGDQFSAENATVTVNGSEPEAPIITAGGQSISEHKNGLAFKFDAAVDGIVIGEEYVADYTNATVTIKGVEYKLITLGAIVNNLGLSGLEQSDVNGGTVRNVEALKVFEDVPGSTCYAVRVINIPEKHLNSEITVRPYFVYEANGEQITVYGEDVVSTYNAAQNG